MLMVFSPHFQLDERVIAELCLWMPRTEDIEPVETVHPSPCCSQLVAPGRVTLFATGLVDTALLVQLDMCDTKVLFPALIPCSLHLSFSLDITYFPGVWAIFGREGSLKRMGRVELELSL